MKSGKEQHSEPIRKRFFKAIDELDKKGELTRYAFAKDNSLNLSNFVKEIKSTSRPIPGWYLAVLVEEYNISAEWLLVGDGDMFVK